MIMSNNIIMYFLASDYILKDRKKFRYFWPLNTYLIIFQPNLMVIWICSLEVQNCIKKLFFFYTK